MKDRTWKHIGKKQLAGAACIVVAFTAVLLVIIFSGNRSGEKAGSGQDSPQDVLSGFYSALISGERETLAEYCDTTSAVMEYIDSFCGQTADLREKEPGALSIASGMVSAGMTGKQKDREGILLDFRLELNVQDTQDGDSPQVKEKTARMKMKDGKWVITDITGR